MCAVLALVMVACGGDDDETARQESPTPADNVVGGQIDESLPPFQIAAILPETGAYSIAAEIALPGFRVGVERVNERGGILGRRVELVVRDSASDPTRAVLAAEELSAEVEPDFYYGGITSVEALALAQFAADTGTPMITPAIAPELGDPAQFPYTFQKAVDIGARVHATLSAVVTVADAEGIRDIRVGILRGPGPAQVELAKGLESDLPQAGVEVVGVEECPLDAADFSTQLQQLRSAGTTVLVYECAGANDNATLGSSVQSLGWDVPMVVGSNAVTGNLEEQFPAQVHDKFYGVHPRFGTRGAYSGAAAEEHDAYMEAVGDTPSLWISASATDFVFFVKWAVETASEESGEVTPDSVVRALESLHESEYPDDYNLVVPNPRWSPEQHAALDVAYSEFWALVGPTPLINGTYESRQPLTLV